MNTDDPPERASRSQIKREAEALQKLGDKLIALPAKQLDRIPLPESVRDAIQQAKRITSHGGLRRQRQYVGRLMRDLDPAPIQAKLAELSGADRVSRAQFQDAERWRERLLSGNDEAIENFLKLHPHADRARLSQLIRAARREAEAGRPPHNARELFRYLHDLRREPRFMPPPSTGRMPQ